MEDRYVRKQGVVDVRFQTHYLTVWMVVTMALLLCCGGLYWYLRTVPTRQLSPDAQRSLDHLVIATFGFIFLLAALMGLYAVIHSHRVAGPAYRINQSMKRILLDDYNFTITLRKGDYLQEIVLQLNTLIGRLRERDERMTALRNAFEKLRQSLQASGSEETRKLADGVATLLSGTAGAPAAPVPPPPPPAPQPPAPVI